jgi:hypothetical protein
MSSTDSRRGPRLLVLLAVVLLPALAVAPRVRAQQPAGTLRAGAAAVKTTPSLDRPVYIAGYDSNRLAESVRDDLWARALVLDDGKAKLAVVSCDLIGLSNYRVRRIRERVDSVPRENVLIATTHVHSGPDTLGLWGPTPFKSGLDPAYMELLERRIVEAVDAAAKDARPVTLAVGTVQVPDGLVYNSREPIQDKELTALRFTDADGKTVASVIHYGAHPEVNKGKAITSDFVHYVREAAEKRFGGTAVFLNGALGGMVTPQVSGHNFAEMERVGVGVGKAAVEALEAAQPVEAGGLSIRQRTVSLPLENERFKLALAAKLLDAGPVAASLETEVWRIDTGPVTWVTIPGEILPKPAFTLKEKMPGKHRLVLAMGNDEIGYILDPEDFENPRYRYERSMSVGKQTWPLLFQAAQELLK